MIMFIASGADIWYNEYGVGGAQWVLQYYIYLKGETTMRVNPRTVKIILDFVAAFALAAGDVIVKDFIMKPKLESLQE